MNQAKSKKLGISTANQTIQHLKLSTGGEERRGKAKSTRSVPLCSPRKTSLNFFSGLLKSPDEDIVAVGWVRGSTWVKGHGWSDGSRLAAWTAAGAWPLSLPLALSGSATCGDRVFEEAPLGRSGRHRGRRTGQAGLVRPGHGLSASGSRWLGRGCFRNQASEER